MLLGLESREDAVAPVSEDSTVMLDDQLLGESWQFSVNPLQDVTSIAPLSAHLARLIQ
jgi:hypothetical protein